MKKVLSVLMVVAAMMFATNANAQIKFGLKGGLDVTNMSLIVSGVVKEGE